MTQTKLSKKIVLATAEGKIYSKSTVTDSKNKQGLRTQKLNFMIAGFHRRACKPVLKKLSVYENYPQYLEFVKDSGYNPQTGQVQFLLASNILPMKMVLDFKIPRIKKPGIYPFTFEKGFLKGLKGLITIINEGKRCYFYTTANWQGPHSKFPNFIFEFFSSTLSKLAMTNLFRISQTL